MPRTAERIVITEADREAMGISIPPTCPVCGDDGDLHEWIERDTGTGKIVRCDRSPKLPARTSEFSSLTDD